MGSGDQRIPPADELLPELSPLPESARAARVPLLIWIASLLRPLPPPAPPPTLFSEEESVTMLKQVLERMRGVAEEMKRSARSKWK